MLFPKIYCSPISQKNICSLILKPVFTYPLDKKLHIFRFLNGHPINPEIHNKFVSNKIISPSSLETNSLFPLSLKILEGSHSE